jgi:hypothetical protein
MCWLLFGNLLGRYVFFDLIHAERNCAFMLFLLYISLPSVGAFLTV